MDAKHIWLMLSLGLLVMINYNINFVRKPGTSNEIYLPGEPVITLMSWIRIKMIVGLAQH